MKKVTIDTEKMDLIAKCVPNMKRYDVIRHCEVTSTDRVIISEIVEKLLKYRHLL